MAQRACDLSVTLVLNVVECVEGRNKALSLLAIVVRPPGYAYYLKSGAAMLLNKLSY